MISLATMGGTLEEQATERRRERSVLIAARPGRMRDSLVILLKTVPRVEVVASADDSSSALGMALEHRPALVVVDTNLPGEGFLGLLRGMKAMGTPSRCLVVTNNARERSEAQAAGADGVLLKGFRVAMLFEVAERLLAPGSPGPEPGSWRD